MQVLLTSETKVNIHLLPTLTPIATINAAKGVNSCHQSCETQGQGMLYQKGKMEELSNLLKKHMQGETDLS